MFLGQEMQSGHREYAESTQTYIDDEITRMVNERYDRVIELLKEKKHILEKVTQELLKREVLNTETFEELVDESLKPGLQVS